MDHFFKSQNLAHEPLIIGVITVAEVVAAAAEVGPVEAEASQMNHHTMTKKNEKNCEQTLRESHARQCKTTAIAANCIPHPCPRSTSLVQRNGV